MVAVLSRQPWRFVRGPATQPRPLQQPNGGHMPPEVPKAPPPLPRVGHQVGIRHEIQTDARATWDSGDASRGKMAISRAGA